MTLPSESILREDGGRVGDKDNEKHVVIIDMPLPPARETPTRTQSEPLPDFPSLMTAQKSIRHQIKFSERRFDVQTLPADLQRVYANLARDQGEDYALTVVFTLRTAVALHRAWHMTLLTHKVLQQIKDKFQLQMTWNLGVIRLKFRVQDGQFELHRKVPYDCKCVLRRQSRIVSACIPLAAAFMDQTPHIPVHEYRENASLLGLLESSPVTSSICGLARSFSVLFPLSDPKTTRSFRTCT